MSDHSHEIINQAFTWGVPLSVLVASFIASPHCAVMCGPLALNFAQNRGKLALYQIGRLVGYLAMGALAGSFGATFLSLGKYGPWLSALSLAFISATLLVMGVRAWMGRPFHMRLPGPLERLSSLLWRKLGVSRLPRHLTAFLAGSLTVFLPCGHLYGFLAASAATGSAFGGAVFMSAFWVGTVPALGFGAKWVTNLMKPGIERAPRFAASLLILAGIFSMAAFATRLPIGSETQKPESPTRALRCH